MNKRTRNWLAVGAMAALLPFGVANVGAAGVTTNVGGAATAMATGFDRAIDLMVQQRVAAQKLSPALALVAREQMQIQFMSLSKEAQGRLLAAAQNLKSEESVGALANALHSAVTDEARQALAASQAEQNAKVASGQAQRLAPKLGADGDLVFIATVGPCRVWDSRFGMGPLAAFGATQVWGYSDNGAYLWGFDQGGTGQAGVGNCAGTVYSGTRPVSVVATVAVVNTFSTGSMRAWNGGTTLTVGGILGWNAGDVLSNTTVIPMNRFIAAYPGSGGKRDFGIYNNSPTPIDFIVDVVGYFIENQATALDCTSVSGPGYTLGAGVSTLFDTPACPAGYTPIMGQPVTNQFGVDAGTILQTSCRISNYNGSSAGVNCDALCCRVPGR